MLARRREAFGFATVLFHVSGCAVVEGRLKDMGYVSHARTRGARESTCSVVPSEHDINCQALATYNLCRLKQEGVERLEGDMGIDRLCLMGFYQYRGQRVGEIC